MKIDGPVGEKSKKKVSFSKNVSERLFDQNSLPTGFVGLAPVSLASPQRESSSMDKPKPTFPSNMSKAKPFVKEVSMTTRKESSNVRPNLHPRRLFPASEDGAGDATVGLSQVNCLILCVGVLLRDGSFYMGHLYMGFCIM